VASEHKSRRLQQVNGDDGDDDDIVGDAAAGSGRLAAFDVPSDATFGG
jgi:hypothetical protein